MEAVIPSVGTSKVPARDIASQIEIVADAAKNITSRGNLDSFVKYFRDRFEKMSMILHERSDVRGARSIADALDAPSNEKVKFIAMIMGRSFTNVIIVIGITSWPSTARIVRAQVLSVKENDYVTAGRVTGASNLRIMLRHVLPNCLSPIIVASTLQIGLAILRRPASAFLVSG
jgi:hypothetical protein